MSAPLGNQNALKYDTPEKRKELCKQYCDYIRQGFGKEYFPECDYDTFKSYCERFPVDFPTDVISRAEREGKHALQKIMFAGMLGNIPGFRERTAIFVSKNMLGWRDKQDVDIDPGGNTAGLVIYMPKKEPL